MPYGHVHSVEIGGFVDGPGARFVAFLNGCPLRCLYCHNPDSWRLQDGALTSADELLARIGHAAAFLSAAGGGVTLSGGEPLAQPEFALAILRGSRALGLHTAFDTSGYLGERATPEILDATDLVLLDIKSFDADTHRTLTGVDVAPTLAFAKRLAEQRKPVWIRFVLVPGVTDAYDNLAGLAEFVATLPNVERTEILPLHHMARPKWRALGKPYPLDATPVPSEADLDRAREIFSAAGVRIESDLILSKGARS
jgi:pyruvate formate lyase activating enzyme